MQVAVLVLMAVLYMKEAKTDNAAAPAPAEAVRSTRLNQTDRANLQGALRKMNHCDILAHAKISDLTTLDQVELNACPGEIEQSFAAVRSVCKQLQSGTGEMSVLEQRISSVCDEATARRLF
jgi:hypothetical protein